MPQHCLLWAHTDHFECFEQCLLSAQVVTKMTGRWFVSHSLRAWDTNTLQLEHTQSCFHMEAFSTDLFSFNFAASVLELMLSFSNVMTRNYPSLYILFYWRVFKNYLFYWCPLIYNQYLLPYVETVCLVFLNIFLCIKST